MGSGDDARATGARDPDTARLPARREQRLVVVPVGEVRGLCLEVQDLVLSKLAAGRDKHREFALGAARNGLVERAVLLERVPSMDVDAAYRAALSRLVDAAFPGAR